METRTNAQSSVSETDVSVLTRWPIFSSDFTTKELYFMVSEDKTFKFYLPWSFNQLIKTSTKLRETSTKIDETNQLYTVSTAIWVSE